MQIIQRQLKMRSVSTCEWYKKVDANDLKLMERIAFDQQSALKASKGDFNLVEKVTHENQYAIAVLLDLRRAFETIDKRISAENLK